MNFYTSAIRHGNNILVRGYNDHGHFSKKVPYQPKLFVPSKAKDAKWLSIDGKPLDSIDFSSIQETKEFIGRYTGVTGFSMYGFQRFEYAFLNEEYPNEVVYDQDKIRIANIDIETDSSNGFPNMEYASEEIISITLKKDKTFYVFGCKEYTTDREDVKYTRCKNEEYLLHAFLEEWERYGQPDILTGWNVSLFDIPYLVKRITNILSENDAKRLSPWKKLTERKTTVYGRDHDVITIVGVSTLDYLELYRKFTYSQQESYRLDHIAFVHLKENKFDFRQMGFETLDDFYRGDYQNFITYNIRDVELVDKLDDELKLIDVALTLAYDAKVNYNDVFTQVKMWDVIIHNHLYKKNIAIPLIGGGYKDESYVGAYVKEPVVGMSDWILSFDLDSLYPHLIMQYNISPETMLVGNKANVTVDDLLGDKDIPMIDGYCLAPNGSYFKTDKQGFLPEIMERMYLDRTIYKEKMIVAQKGYESAQSTKEKRQFSKYVSRYKNMQMAKKIQLNSAYGAIGNPYFRFFNLDQATAITIGGQLSIRWVEKYLNEYLNKLLKSDNIDYVIASDTDSLYITLSDLVKKIFPECDDKAKIVDFLDKVSDEKFKPVIDKIYMQLCDRMKAFQQKMNMKREVIADRGIWTAKKRYILNVHDSEGVRYENPKLKMMGIETVKSSTPSSCRSALTEALKLIMNSTEESVQKYIGEFKIKFKSLPFEEISFPRSAQEVKKYTNNPGSVPIHVRGAITFNAALKQYKLTKKYETIKDGEKVKFCYMKLPNPLKENVLSIISVLPNELELEQYIDYDLQFQKSFLDPLRSILNVIGWEDEKKSNLEDFFS